MTYSGLIHAAKRLIETKGAACVWRSSQHDPDPEKPWTEADSTSTDHPTHVALLPFDSTTRRMFGYDEGRAIPAGSLVGYVPGSTEFTPALRDTLVVGTKTYTIARLDALNPNADQDIVYIVELRQ